MLWDWELELERRQWRRGKDTKDSGRVNTFLIVFVLLRQKKDCAYFAFGLTINCQELFLPYVTRSLSTSYNGAGAAPA
jgi:hypothetical protein